MPNEQDPIVQNWYQFLDKGQKFKVVAVDEDSGYIEIQHYDGDVEEIEMDVWDELDIEFIEPPEDWTGPVDYVERDDMGYTETGMSREDWSASLREVYNKEESLGEEDLDELDEWGEGFPKEEPWEGED
jgi:Family of unknown function (DUF6763)